MRVSCEIMTVVKVRFPLTLFFIVIMMRPQIHIMRPHVIFFVVLHRGQSKFKRFVCTNLHYLCKSIDQLYFFCLAYSWYSIQSSVGIPNDFKAQGLISWYCIYIQLTVLKASLQSSYISAQFEYRLFSRSTLRKRICLFVACTDDMPTKACI